VTLTLGEWVEEYLEAHQGERVTVAKLRWLLGKATAGLGEVRLAELSPEQVCVCGSPFRRGTASRRPKRCGTC